MNGNHIAADFVVEWAQHVGATGALAHHLREAGLRPWIRFHALPESQRYATSPAEKELILGRADNLATEILGNKSACWLVECRTDDFDERFTVKVKGRAALKIDEPGCDYSWTAYVFPTRWVTGSSRRLLWQVADDRTGPTLWINRTSGAIFAPYDGGFDLFPTSQAQVKAIRSKYKSWLSDRADGL